MRLEKNNQIRMLENARMKCEWAYAADALEDRGGGAGVIAAMVQR
jgi:hypothetical protein